ncbi:TPA: hypothetical protein RZC63_004089 [Escherichia coli]|uniref:hypothetical protein n=1 Tax=Escherichia coli TaxID=562 RepID=UPI00263BDECD|nr:hypothetical protein [Escherichia coli]WKC07566.1 hypothetical protein PY720_25725 [Escherichia coli]HEB3585648.1 hypothetical protein [Escherichia coli]
MNLVDAFVKKVISEPYEEYGKWWIDVEYISWGVSITDSLHTHDPTWYLRNAERGPRWQRHSAGANRLQGK